MSLAQTEKSNTAKRWLLVSVFASFLMHLLMMPLTIKDQVLNFVQNVEPKKEQVIAIQLRSDKPTQIVNATEKESDATEKEANFLSEKDRFFEKEKVAKTTGTYREAAKGTSEIEAAKSVARPAVKPVAAVEKPKEKPQKIDPSSLRFSDLSVAKEVVVAHDKETLEQEFRAMGIESGMADDAGLAQNNDFVEDIPLGDTTLLNTQEYMYYGFYHRIRQRLEQHWGKSLQESAERLYRSGRRLPASEQRITSLSVTMDDKGNIIDVKVRNASGVNELDDAAIESFNRAGPFPNPPQGMVVNGKIQIEWGFVVKS